jgi:hypothetical protein
MAETTKTVPQGDEKYLHEELEQKADIPAALKKHEGIGEEQIQMFRQFDAADAEWHTKKTKALLRKVDIHLLPMLVLMYLLNFLDRK